MSIQTRKISPWAAVACIAALPAGTGAVAAANQRMAVTNATGSGGATTFLQSTVAGGALQGEVASAARTSIAIPFGVLGEYDPSTAHFGAGVLGISVSGYGVGAESLNGNPSVIGLNTSGGQGGAFYGENGGDALDVEGLSNSVGIDVYSDGENAIEAFSVTDGIAATYSEDQSSNAGYGSSNVSSSAGGIGAAGFSTSGSGGIGLFGESASAAQGLPAIQAFTEVDGTELFDAGVADSNTNNAFSVSTVLTSVSKDNSGGVYTQGRASSDLQINGDIYLTGGVYTNCGSDVPYTTAACSDVVLGGVRSSGGSDYQMYASKHASQTVEDEGEAELRGGVAHIALDPAFASVISKQAPYLVFTTPLGDTRGLYVTNRTATSFDVRETGGGHASLTFDYRIVAHPFGDRGKRMAIRSQDAGRGTGRPAFSKALAMHERQLAQMHGHGASRAKHQHGSAPASFVNMTSGIGR